MAFLIFMYSAYSPSPSLPKSEMRGLYAKNKSGFGFGEGARMTGGLTGSVS